ncbi:MAG: hypothetical protein QM783_11935 [Phycisphaerales bacterium]
MQTNTSRSRVILGIALGAGLTGAIAAMMGQGAASQPVKSEPQYFVTADGEEGAHLWVREGATLRVVAHGECKECKAKGHEGHEHKEGDGHGHDHGKDAPAAPKK